MWTRVLDLLVACVIAKGRRQEVRGDLAELWEYRRAHGRRDLRRASLRDLAGLVQKQTWRGATHGGFAVWQDVKYAVRSWIRRPVAALAVVTVLALGIGASTAIFTAVDVLLWKPLPFPSPERLVHVTSAPVNLGPRTTVFRSFLKLPEIAAAGLWQQGGANLEVGHTSHRVLAAVVDDGFFWTLAVPPLVGDYLPPFDGTSRNVVISHSLWRTHFGGDPGLVSRNITLNARPYTVTGVMPPGFAFPAGADLWVPPGADYQVSGEIFGPKVVARLATGVSLAQAEAAVVAYETRGLEAAGRGALAPDALPMLEPLSRRLTHDSRPTLTLLALCVSLLLLAVCTSVANILLARVSSRTRELEIRRALGASRWRLVRQQVIDGLLLSTIGTVSGVLLAMWALGGLRSLAPAELGNVGLGAMDARLLAIAASVMVAAALLVSLAPAMIAGTRPSVGLVRVGRGDGQSRGWRRLRGALLVGQMAMALVLLSASTAAVDSLLRMARVDPGFGRTQAVAAHVTLPRAHFATEEAVQNYIDRAISHVASAPSVKRAAAAVHTPGFSGFGWGLYVKAMTPAPVTGDPRVTMSWLTASRDYFAVMGIRQIAGRGFSSGDRRGSPLVAVLSESAARRLFNDPARAVGASIEAEPGRTPQIHTVVGVVADVKMRGITANAGGDPQIYFAMAQTPDPGGVTIVAEIDGDAAASLRVVQDALSAVDVAVPAYDLHTIESVIDRYLAAHRLTGALMSAFAVITLIVAAAGLYGLMAQVVGERQREIGIRLALGATARDVRARLIGYATILTLTGAVVGAAAAAGSLRALGALVPVLQDVSPSMVAVQAFALLAAGVLAAWWPTARVLTIDPAQVLRDDAS